MKMPQTGWILYITNACVYKNGGGVLGWESDMVYESCYVQDDKDSDIVYTIIHISWLYHNTHISVELKSTSCCGCGLVMTEI